MSEPVSDSLRLFHFESKDDANGQLVETTWPKFAAYLQRHKVTEDKRAEGLFCPMTFGERRNRKGHRRHLDNCDTAQLLVIDIDHSTEAGSAHLLGVLAGLDSVVTSSFSHGLDGEYALRAVVLLSRPVDMAEYQRIWLRYQALIGGAVDNQTKDPTRSYFVPSVHPDREPYSVRLEGVALDVDSVLPSCPEVAAARQGGINQLWAGPLAEIVEVFKSEFQGQGHRHEAFMALAGTLVRDGWPEGRCVEFIDAACEAYGYRPHSPDVVDTYRKATHGLPYTAESRLQLLVEQSDNKDRLNKALDRLRLMGSLHVSDTGGVKSDPHNVSMVLALHPAWSGTVAYDHFSREIIKTTPIPSPAHIPPDSTTGVSSRNWTDNDTAIFRTWWSAVYFGGAPPKDDVYAAVQMVGRGNSVHVVRDYLNGLPPWDGKVRAGRLFIDYFGCEDSEYARLVSRFFVVGAVKRVFEPGCKVDTSVILEGEQGIFKSSGLQALMPVADWFKDTSPNFGSKDGLIALTKVWLHEIPELGAIKRSEVELIKNIFSSAVDTFRPPYGRCEESYPRQCVLVGTTNEMGYLRDETGNRRFHPIRCGTIIKDEIRRQRDQIWAEALQLYQSGARHYPTPAEQHLFEPEQASRLEEDDWLEPIAKYLDGLVEICSKAAPVEGAMFPALDPWEGVSVRDVLDSVEQLSGFNQSKRVAACFRKLGWRPWPTMRGRRKRNGAHVSVWIPPPDMPRPEHSKAPLFG